MVVSAKGRRATAAKMQSMPRQPRAPRRSKRPLRLPQGRTPLRRTIAYESTSDTKARQNTKLWEGIPSLAASLTNMLIKAKAAAQPSI